MDAVPFTWRARKGYVSAPTPEPEAEPTSPAPAPATQIMVSHNYYVVVPQPQPLAYAAQLFQASPVTIASPAAPSKKSSSAKSTKSSSKKADPEDDGPKVSPPPPPPPPAPAAPASDATLVEEPKKDVNEPPALRPGMNYMFPAEHTKLHIFNKSSKVWGDKHTGKSFNFKIFNVATTFTPKMVIDNVLKGADAGKWAITEVVEKGDGAWAKGTTIEYAGERASCSLASMGWTGKRGDVLPPVWVVVHKV